MTTDSSGHARASRCARARRAPASSRSAPAPRTRAATVITAASSVWVWDARVSEYAYRYPTLEAFADRERYQPGDTARILVNTDVRNATVLAAVEGRDVEDVQRAAAGRQHRAGALRDEARVRAQRVRRRSTCARAARSSRARSSCRSRRSATT